MDKKLNSKEFIFLVLIGIALAAFAFFQAAQASPLEEARRITEACKGVGKEQVSHEKCTAKEFADLGDKNGLSFIGDTLSVYQSINTGYQSYQSCHVLSHRIMNDLGAREKGAWKGLLEAMGRGELDPTRCGGGFMHGAIEARASEDPDFKVNAELYNEVCGKPEAIHYSSSCAHILGHLALVGAYGSIDEAIDSCDGLTGDFLFQCYGGIFMEDSMRTNLNDHGISPLPKKDDAWLKTQVSRCSRYSDNPEIVNGCWYDLPEVFAQTHNYNLDKIYDFCSSAPSKAARDRCYVRGSYLVMIVPKHLFKDSYKQTLCSVYQSNTKELDLCMRDVVGAALTGSMEFLERTVSFCGARPKAAHEACFKQISSFLSHSKVAAPRRAELCATLPEEYAGSCSR
jgi:hypothetical protein